MRFTITVEGEKVIDRTLARYIDNMTDATPAFEAIGDQFAQAETAIFLQQGPGWAPLSPKYAAYKARYFPGMPILIRTGKLQQSLTSRPFGHEQIRAQSGEYGTSVNYAKYHQHGTSKMPQRRPVNVPEATRKAMAKTMQRYLTTGNVF